jgi:thermostable 8-oxoguanine DNA glycosylase
MASAILKFIHPAAFPIIDVRAYRALTGKRLRTHHYSTQLYLEYVDELMKIADARQMDLARVDEQLY